MPRGGSSSAGATHRSSDDDGSEAAVGRPAPTSSAKKKQAGKKKPAKKSATNKRLDEVDAGVEMNASSRRDRSGTSKNAGNGTVTGAKKKQAGKKKKKPTPNAEDGGSSATLAALVDQFERNNRRRDQEAVPPPARCGHRLTEEELNGYIKDFAESNKKVAAMKAERQAAKEHLGNVEAQVDENTEQIENLGKRMGGDGAFDMQQRYELQRVKSLAVGILFGDDPDAMKILQLSENSMEVAVMAIQSKLVTKVDEDVLYSDRMTSAIQDVVWDYKRAASTTKSEGD